MSVTKDLNSDKLVGVLSSDVMDREEETISKNLLRKWVDTKALPALTDHKNSIENYAGGWKNFRLEEKDGSTFLLAEPLFFKSNPNTAHLEAMVREAKEMDLPFGISIGAMVTEAHTIDRNGKSIIEWGDAELLEASWVAIPANQTAGIMKSLNKFKSMTPPQEESTNSEKMVEEKKSQETVVEEVKEKTVEKEISQAKIEDAKSLDENKVNEMIANAVKSVEEKLEAKSASDEKLQEMISDQIVKALEEQGAAKKSVDVPAEKTLDITNLTNG